MQPANTVGQGVRYPVVVGGEVPPTTQAASSPIDGFHTFVKWLEALFQHP
jgi:hypothetical protein